MVGLLPSMKVGFICFNESPLKTMKKFFLFHPQKLFSIQRYLNFRPDLFGHVIKPLDKKANLKIYGVIN